MEAHRLRRAGRLLFAGNTLILVASCAARVAAPDAAGEIAHAIGSTSSIELRVEGGPVDAPSQGAERLTLADAVKLAVDRSARLQGALAQVRVALADAQQARLLPNPILSFVLRFPEGGGSADVEAGVSAELAAILKRPRRIDAADKHLRAAVANAVAVGLDVVIDIRERYAAVQSSDELLPLLRERAVLLDRLLEVARSRLELGESARVEVTTIQTQRVELDIDIADAELDRREARVALARAIGEPSAAAEWQLDAWAPTPTQTAGEQAWIGAALKRRPEIQAHVLELAALGDEAALAALALWDGSSIAVEAERDGGDWSLGPGIALPIPIFDLGDARRDRANAQIVAARHDLVELSRQVVEEVRHAFARFTVASSSLARVRDELLPLQRQRREEVESIFLGGQTDVTVLLLAERDLQATQARLVQLEQRAAQSLAELERAVGGPATARDVEQGRTDSDPQPKP